ncbi:MAG: DUF6484 domain-containing protein [Steroidobacteraceae bacterium]
MSTVESDLSETRAACTEPAASAGWSAADRFYGVLTGTLVGFTEEGAVPLVLYPGQPGSAALGASTTIDVGGAQIGRPVALMLEGGDPRRPMIIGLLRMAPEWPLDGRPATVQVDADGEQLVVSAREQVVLRCGKASITLTKAGKILIQGAYLSNRSSGVLRLKGGSVQIN